MKICDGGVAGRGRGSNLGDFLRDIIKVWHLTRSRLKTCACRGLRFIYIIYIISLR